MWSSSSSSSAIVRPSSQILVCTTRATISSTQTIAFLSSDLVRFLFKPLSSNSSDPRQFFLRKKVRRLRPLLEPSLDLLKAYSSSNCQFLLRGIVSTLLVSLSAFAWGAIVIDLCVIAMIPSSHSSLVGSRPVVSFLPKLCLAQ